MLEEWFELVIQLVWEPIKGILADIFSFLK